jgi:hypothetical protein
MKAGKTPNPDSYNLKVAEYILAIKELKDPYLLRRGICGAIKALRSKKMNVWRKVLNGRDK